MHISPFLLCVCLSQWENLRIVENCYLTWPVGGFALLNRISFAFSVCVCVCGNIKI